MRTLRVSPLMRRASPLGYGGRDRGLDEASKGLAGRSSTSSVETENRGDNIVELPKGLANSANHKKSPHATGTGIAGHSTCSLPGVSTPVRNNAKATEASASSLDGNLSEADRAHAQLQQMWDDGELSPRAPLDRSLGYFSSASPLNAGKALSAPAATDAAGAENTRSQQNGGLALYINDVRALRQMAPFSSAEEQVLTRSQRRRSSANLLQQLVAVHPQGPTSGAHVQHRPAEVTQQAEHENLLSRPQQLQPSVAASKQQQENEPEIQVHLVSSSSPALGIASLSATTAAPRVLGVRKRRASSPAASTFSFSLDPANLPDQRESSTASEGPPRAKGRRRLSPAVEATQGSASTGASSLGVFRSSPRRTFAGQGEGGCGSSDAVLGTSTHSSSGKIESPFQKHPPPSPSDFPVASPHPIASPISASRCSPRRLTATGQQQLHQGRDVAASPVRRLGNEALRPNQKQQHLGTSLWTSPRRSHGAARTSCLPFQTPRSPCCSTGASEAAAGASFRRKDSRLSLSPLPLEGTRGRRATKQQRCRRSLAPDASGLVMPLPASEALPAASGAGERNTQSLKESPVSRRASAAAVSKSKETHERSFPGIPEVTSKRNLATAKGEMIAQSGIGRKASSPIRTVPSRPPWQHPGRAGTAGAASSFGQTDEQRYRRPVVSTASPAAAAKRRAEGPAESAGTPAPVVEEDAGSSAGATAGGRKRSLARRGSSVLPTNASLSASLMSASVSGPISGSLSLVASQEAASATMVPKATAATAGLSQGEDPCRPRPAAWIKGSSSKAAIPQGPLHHAADRVPAAMTVVGAAARTKKGEQEAPPAAAPAAARGAARGAATALTASRRRLALAARARLSEGKIRAARSSNTSLQQGRNANRSNSSLQQSCSGIPTPCSRVRIIPITKRPPVSAGDKHEKSSGTSTTKTTPALRGEASRAPRCSRARAVLARPCRNATTAPEAGASPQRRRLLQCYPKRRTKTSPRPSKATPEANNESVEATAIAAARSSPQTPHSKVNGDHGESALPPVKILSPSRPKKPTTQDTLPAAAPDDARDGNNENSTSDRSHATSNCTSCKVGSTSPSSMQPVTSSSAVSSSPVDTGESTAAVQRVWATSRSPPPSRRRSSSPHHLSLYKSTSDDAREEKQQTGEHSTSMRRASSACNIGECMQQRMSAQQQQQEALHEEWAGRDREYQEKQQNLLLEQQRKEMLLAWEQREAELLKNRKALSKEEPSFWGFDPFMVDEEDEKVLTTEDLRVEVSRFLKGRGHLLLRLAQDLRFHSRADLLRVVKKFSEQTRTTTTTTSSRLNFTRVEQRVVPMAARQVHGTVPHERRRKSILRTSNGGQHPECRRRSRGISFSPFNKVQLYMLDEHERASKEAAANLSQQGEQRQQLRQKLAQQFQLMLLRGDSDLELALLRRELAELYDPEEEEDLAFLSPTLAPGREAEGENRGTSPIPSQQEEADGLKPANRDGNASLVSAGSGTGGRLPFTVSPSWRQRPLNAWQETPGASQIEPCAEWSPPPSPFGDRRFNGSAGKEGSGCWRPPLSTTGSDPESDHAEVGFGNDENADSNATCSRVTLSPKSALEELQQPPKELPIEEPPKHLGLETIRRPSVLSRRLSVVPNVHSP